MDSKGKRVFPAAILRSIMFALNTTVPRLYSYHGQY